MEDNCKECIFFSSRKVNGSTKIRYGYCLYSKLQKVKINKKTCNNFLPNSIGLE